MISQTLRTFAHPLLLMAVICMFLIAYAVNVATNKKRHQNLGIYVLVLFTGVAALAAYHANELFQGFENIGLYRDFCTYLCSEFLSAVIILFGFTILNYLTRAMTCGEALMVMLFTLGCIGSIIWVISNGPPIKVDKVVIRFLGDLAQKYCLDDIVIGLSVGGILFIIGIKAPPGMRRLVLYAVLLTLFIIMTYFALLIYRMKIPLYIFYQLLPLGVLSILAAIAGGLLAAAVDSADNYGVFITVVAIASMTLYGIFSNIHLLGMQPMVMITVEMVGAIVTTLLVEETLLSH